MATYDEYVKQVTEKNKGNLDANKNTINTNADNSRNEVNKQYDTANNLITENYNTQIKDTSDSYESALRTNEVQKLINERAVARRSAELGLTDSGLNRTQQTAVQLSYSNQKGNLEVQRQKAVDTLAAAMRTQIAQNESKRSSALTEIENTRNANILQAENNFNSSVNSTAAELYKSEQEAKAKVEAARIESETKAKAENKLDYSAIDKFNNQILSKSEYEAKFKNINKNSTNSAYKANVAKIAEINKQIETLKSDIKETPFVVRNKHKVMSSANQNDIKAAKAEIEELEVKKKKIEAENASILKNESQNNYNNYIKDLLQKHYEVYHTINEATLCYLLDYYQIT